MQQPRSLSRHRTSAPRPSPSPTISIMPIMVIRAGKPGRSCSPMAPTAASSRMCDLPAIRTRCGPMPGNLCSIGARSAAVSISSMARVARCSTNATSSSPPGLLHYGYIAAPDTDVDQPYGLIFVSCHLHKEKGVEPQTIALGRPWRRNPRAVGETVYMRCWMDDHIVPEGWYHMQYYAKDGSVQFMEPEEG